MGTSSLSLEKLADPTHRIQTKPASYLTRDCQHVYLLLTSVLCVMGVHIS